MKGRIVGIVVGLALVGVVAVRVNDSRIKNKPQETSEAVVVVRTQKVERTNLTDRLYLTGNIRPKNEVDIFAKVSGRIDSLAVQVGDKVKSGQVLATVEHRETAWQVKAQQAAVQVAKASFDSAKLDYDRTAALHQGGSAPQAQLEGAKAKVALAQAQLAQAEAAAGLASTQLDNARIESPISGVLTRRNLNLGSQVGPAQYAFTIQDTHSLKLETSVDGLGFSRLSKNQEAVVRVDAFPNETFVGRVSVLSPSLDVATRRASIEIEVDNASGRLLPNMFAQAEVDLGQLQDVLVIPHEALLEAAGATVVYRVRNGHAEALKPKLGTRDRGWVALLSDELQPGDEVAVTALGMLADGANVKTPTEAQASKLAPKKE